MRTLIVLAMLLLVGCDSGPDFVDPHDVGSVTCYAVHTGAVIAKWETAHLNYRSYDGRDHVSVYLTKQANLNGLPKAIRNPEPIADWHVNEVVCTIKPQYSIEGK